MGGMGLREWREYCRRFGVSVFQYFGVSVAVQALRVGTTRAPADFFTSTRPNFCKWLIEHPKLYRFFTIFVFSPGKVRRCTTAKPDRFLTVLPRIFRSGSGGQGPAENDWR